MMYHREIFWIGVTLASLGTVLYIIGTIKLTQAENLLREILDELCTADRSTGKASPVITHRTGGARR